MLFLLSSFRIFTIYSPIWDNNLHKINKNNRWLHNKKRMLLSSFFYLLAFFSLSFSSWFFFFNHTKTKRVKNRKFFVGSKSKMLDNLKVKCTTVVLLCYQRDMWCRDGWLNWLSDDCLFVCLFLLAYLENY